MNLCLSGFKKVSLLPVLVGVFCLTDMINPNPTFGFRGIMITAQKGDLNYADDTGYGRVTYDYYIGKYETTHTEYCEFLNAVAATDSHSLWDSGMHITRTEESGGYSYSAELGWNGRPVERVNWYSAARFCNWLHNDCLNPGSTETESGAYNFTSGDSDDPRGYDDCETNDPVTHESNAYYWIPTMDEWYKAAYYIPDTYNSYYDYPTGSNDAPTAESPPGGTNSANFSNAVGTTTDVGAYTDSPSPYGTFDQSGNVWEWIEDWHLVGTFRVVRGGSWGNTSSSLASSSWGYCSPVDGYDTLGFRVASSIPEPSALLLFSLGVLPLFWCTRRKRRN